MVLAMNARYADESQPEVPGWAAAAVVADALRDFIAEAEERVADIEVTRSGRGTGP